MAIEIVDSPIKNGDFPWQNVSSPEGNHPLTVLILAFCNYHINPASHMAPTCKRWTPKIRKKNLEGRQVPWFSSIYTKMEQPYLTLFECDFIRFYPIFYTVLYYCFYPSGDNKCSENSCFASTKPSFFGNPSGSRVGLRKIWVTSGES